MSNNTEKISPSDRTKTVARYILRIKNVIQTNKSSGNSVLDIDLLRSLTEEELIRCRNVGKATIEVINKLKEALEWVY